MGETRTVQMSGVSLELEEPAFDEREPTYEGRIPMRKRSRRYPVQVPVLYKRLDQEEPAQTGTGWTEDLGERGACLKLPTALHLGRRLGLVILTEPEVVEAEASVIWVRAGGQRTFYYHGVEFLHLAPPYYESLLRALPRKRPRRAFHRFPLSLPVFCKVARDKNPALEGQIAYISRAGLMIFLPQQVPCRARIEITPQVSRTERIRGRVRWVANSRDASGMFRHGIEFVRGPLSPQRFFSLLSSTSRQGISEAST
ncbi:MAG: PilZ domain-containing protein [Candidatus Methylomirabilales bacterium]